MGCSLGGVALVKLVCFAEAAFEELGGPVNLQAAAAEAAAISNHDAHAFLATSAGRALEGLHCVMGSPGRSDLREFGHCACPPTCTSGNCGGGRDRRRRGGFLI